MANGQVLQIKQRSLGCRYHADFQLAQQLPELDVPRMDLAARGAFRDVLNYERPPANGSVVDILELAAARGFCAHPSDWIPSFENDARYPSLYQPWADWLSDHGKTPFHEGNTLTRDNWDRWKPKPRMMAFRKMMRDDQDAAFDLLVAVAPTQSASTRLALLMEIDAGGSFHGNYPSQVPILRYFLSDRLAKIRDAAAEKLRRMNGLETEQAHAEVLATHMKVSDGTVSYKVPPAPNSYPFWVNFRCTTFDLLAEALGLTPHKLAQQSNLAELGSNFMLLAVLTADVDTRSIIASRLLDCGEQAPSSLFRGVARPLWERGLCMTFASPYWNSVHEFLGCETGSLDRVQMQDLSCYEFLEPTVLNEIKHRKLPVNTSYDPLRVLGLVLDKEAAGEVLEKSIELGMKPNNPRLTMLRFNLTL